MKASHASAIQRDSKGEAEQKRKARSFQKCHQILVDTEVKSSTRNLKIELICTSRRQPAQDIGRPSRTEQKKTQIQDTPKLDLMKENNKEKNSE